MVVFVFGCFPALGLRIARLGAGEMGGAWEGSRLMGFTPERDVSHQTVSFFLFSKILPVLS